MTITELSAKVPEIPWLTYINTVLAPHHVVKDSERVIVDVPNYFTNLTVLLAKTPKRYNKSVTRCWIGQFLPCKSLIGHWQTI